MKSNKSQAPVTARLDSLTGLRFAAAMLVFLVHSESLVGLGQRNMVGFDKGTSQGVAGVSFFFILSGFVLAWSSRPNDSGRQFWQRRVARILPGYYFYWAVGIVVAILTGQAWRGAITAVPLLQAWIPTGYYDGNGVLWSLSCEAFFYALFPSMIVLFRRCTPKAQMITIAALLIIAIAIPLGIHPSGNSGNPNILFFLIYLFPPVRLIEFALGVLLAMGVRRGWRSPVPFSAALALAAAAYVYAGFLPAYAQPVAATVIPFALLITTAATVDIRGSVSLARWRPIVKLGEWSFAFYLEHQLVIKIAMYLVRNQHLSFGEVLALLALVLAVALTLAWATFTFLEKPLERRFRGDRAVRATAAV